MKKLICVLSLLLALTTGCSTQLSMSDHSTANTISTSGVFSSSRTTPDSKVTNQTKQPDPFTEINMTTTNFGYAITQNRHVLKTLDGGMEWADVLENSASPADLNESAISIPDGETVLIASFTDSGVQVKKSEDAGRSWSGAEIKLEPDDPNSGYGGSLAMSFVNPSDGYLLASGLPAAGKMGKVLYKTADGGSSWSFVSANLNPEKGSEGLTEINGYPTGLAFSSIKTGYITSTYHGQKEVSVYRTGDGGTHWSAASVPLPEKFASLIYERDYYVDAYPPAFYGRDKKSAKMELYFCHNEERHAYIYSSNDGGADWQIEGASNLLMKKYCFQDEQNGFGIDENGTLYTTQNGGLTWLDKY